MAFAGWPPALQKVVEDDFRRASALAGNRRRTADAALRDVVQGLDELLVLAAGHIQAGVPGRSKRLMRKTTPGAAAAGRLGDLPLGEIADLLGIPADEVDEVLDAIRNPAGRSRAERRDALKAIKQLREQLQQVETARDHSRLSRLMSFIMRIVLVLGTAVGSQSVSTLVAGDPQLDALIQTAVGALVAFALERVTSAARDVWRDHDPAVVALASHQALLTALADAEALGGSPAYENEHTIVAFRLLVRTARAWVACFQLDRDFGEKLEYWAALDEITDAIRERSVQDLQTLHRRLEALTPPS